MFLSLQRCREKSGVCGSSRTVPRIFYVANAKSRTLFIYGCCSDPRCHRPKSACLVDCVGIPLHAILEYTQCGKSSQFSWHHELASNLDCTYWRNQPCPICRVPCVDIWFCLSNESNTFAESESCCWGLRAVGPYLGSRNRISRKPANCGMAVESRCRHFPSCL